MNMHNYKFESIFESQQDSDIEPCEFEAYDTDDGWRARFYIYQPSGGSGSLEYLKEGTGIEFQFKFTKSAGDTPANLKIIAEVSFKAGYRSDLIRVSNVNLLESAQYQNLEQTEQIKEHLVSLAKFDFDEAIFKFVEEKAREFKPTEDIYREVYFVDEREATWSGKKVELDELKVRKLPLIELAQEYIYDELNDKHKFDTRGCDVLYQEYNGQRRIYRVESFWSDAEAEYQKELAEIEHFHVHEFSDNGNHPPEYFKTLEEAEAHKKEIFVDCFDGVLEEEDTQCATVE